MASPRVTPEVTHGKAEEQAGCGGRRGDLDAPGVTVGEGDGAAVPR